MHTLSPPASGFHSNSSLCCNRERAHLKFSLSLSPFHSPPASFLVPVPYARIVSFAPAISEDAFVFLQRAAARKSPLFPATHSPSFFSRVRRCKSPARLLRTYTWARPSLAVDNPSHPGFETFVHAPQSLLKSYGRSSTRCSQQRAGCIFIQRNATHLVHDLILLGR